MARDVALVRRFSRTERALHWIHAASFFALLVTGLALYLPALSGALGSRESIKAAHLYTAAGWAILIVLSILVGDRSGLRRTVREIEGFDADDGRWLRRRESRQGRFNAGQKIHAIAQGAFAVLFVVSGLLLWLGEQNTRLRLGGTIVLHDGVTLMATLLVLGHLYLALVHPRTRHSTRGMILGTVREDWAREHHGKWEVRADPDGTEAVSPRPR